ncbi:DUF4012 domain-containing protein [Cellulomonas uda]|uniref:DUF4012 domain-containing protein n=1 Tax=Cellulomonas uda TaxID=1714 RepID=UPI001144FF56|nr:DUF4012 domain-containing protein [Cellulomonas uda]NII67630.1 hypothetical protein [Cellulomonas uda]
MQPRHGRQGRRDARRSRRRRVLAVAGGLLLVLVVAAGVLAVDAVRARDAFEATAADVVRLREQVTDPSSPDAGVTLASAQRHARAARDHTDGPLWALAGRLPWLGADARAVQELARAVDEVTHRALPPLVEATRVVDPAALAPVDGRVDVAPLAAVAAQVADADDAVRSAYRRVAAVRTDGLVAPVADAVRRLRDELARVAADTGTAARAAALLPPMLGTDGPREYLVLVQNEAEPRATGGIPGAVLRLRADDGHVEVLEQRCGGDLSGADEPALALTPVEQDLFGPLLGTDMRDVTFTPDFPRSAQLARAIWARDTGEQVDGVLSVDPETLALVLRATGPVALPDGTTLTGQDAVRVLLNDVYVRLTDPRDQDAFFAQTAAAVFDRVVAGSSDAASSDAGSSDAAGVVDALAEAARRGRLMVWSAHDEEQALLGGTVLSGELAGRVGDRPVVGLYLNDGTQAKVGYYLDADVAVDHGACLAGGAQRFVVRATYTFGPPDGVAGLPWYVVGDGSVVEPGLLRTNFLLYLPAGARMARLTVDGRPAQVHAQVHDGLPVGALTWTFEPGERRSLEVEVVTGPGAPGPVLVRGTPLASGFDRVSAVSSCRDRG